MDPAIRLLRELVAIDSVNPSLVPGAAGEAQIADAIAAHMRALGLDVELQEAAPGRPNVIGVLEGRTKGRSLMLCGHVDTVGVDGMTAPFDPIERDGRLYGRGSQDMKGRRRGDDRRRAGDRGGRTGIGPADHCRRGRRGVREHRRRRARHALAGRCGGRDRAHRFADRDRPQGIRLVRNRDERTRRARQPPEGRARRDPAHGARARATGDAGSHAERARARIRSWGRRHCTPASSTAAAS